MSKRSVLVLLLLGQASALAAPEFVVLEYPNGLQVGGKPATAAQLTGRVLRQVNATSFSAVNLSGRVTRSPWHWRQKVLEPLAPPDNELRTLQQKYEGKRVYPRSTLSCFAGSHKSFHPRSGRCAKQRILVETGKKDRSQRVGRGVLLQFVVQHAMNRVFRGV